MRPVNFTNVSESELITGFPAVVTPMNMLEIYYSQT